VENIWYVHSSIYMHLKQLFNMILKFEYVAEIFKHDMIIPIIKDKHKNNRNVYSCTSITTSSLLSKLFDICVISRISGMLVIVGLQLECVVGGGCERAIRTVV
jgi:hypothetical protein